MSEVEQDSSAAEAQQPPPPPPPPPPPKEEQKTTKMSFSIWPPAERTREAVVKRLIETLSTPSVLSKRYGTLPEDEAASTAELIEKEAFTTAASSSSSAAEDDGIQILQVYSKEISKRMLDAVKARSSSAAADAGDDSNVDVAAS